MINRYIRAALARTQRDSLPVAQGAGHAGPAWRRRPPAVRRPPRRPAPGWPRPRRRPGRPPRSAADGMTVVLADGSPVLIRPVRATDGPLLAEICAGLSPASRWMRFLAAKETLTAAELRYLTCIDHHHHEALAAVDPRGRGLAEARYIRHPDDPQAAEIAVTVIDAWHGRGLGTELVRSLAARARQHDIHRFTALASADNLAVARLLGKFGAELVHSDAQTVEYRIPLTVR